MNDEMDIQGTSNAKTVREDWAFKEDSRNYV